MRLALSTRELRNFFKRREYRIELEGKISLAKLSGFNKTGSGCLLARNLAEVSRLPVDRAIEAAADLK